MKIYPSNHVIREVERPKFLDIPLSHIEKNYIPTEVVAELNPELVQSESSYIAPYQKFNTDDFLIFEDDGTLSKTELVFQDGKYVYRPQDAKEYKPSEFSCNVLLQRKGQLRGDKNYNIRVGVYDGNYAEDLASHLMTIFGDAPYRGVAPANILVNGCSTDLNAMITKDASKFDFLFVQGADVEFLKDLKDSIPYQEFFKSHVNLWVTLTDEGSPKWFRKLKEGELYKVTQIVESENGKYEFMAEDDPRLRSYTYASENAYGWAAYEGVAFRQFDRNRYKYLFGSTQKTKSPIIIMERPNGSYIVVSHESMFEHLNQYGPFVYNVMMELYRRSFLKITSKKYWVTEHPVDYLGSLNVPFHRTHPSINLQDIIAESHAAVDGYDVKRIYSNDPGVVLDRRMENGDLYFKRVGSDEPEKKPDDTTIFTYQHTVLQYEVQKKKIVESGLKISTSVENGRCFVTVLPFSSSKYKLLWKSARTFELESVDKEYIIYALPIGETGESIVGLVRADDKDFDKEASIQLARVHTVFYGEPVAYDIRQLGGGLPEKLKDYDMIDIGNSKGRPYRVGVGAVIRLPKAYQKYADKIQQAVESYKVAADKFYVVYE